MRLPTGDELHVGWSVWPVEQLVEANRHGRARPFRFAPAGVEGIVFALDGACVVAEYAVDPRTITVAASLEDFLRRWSSGELAV